MSGADRSGPSAYALVVKYLRSLQCPNCGGVGGTVRGGKDVRCQHCGGTGFKNEEPHLLVAAKQVRR